MECNADDKERNMLSTNTSITFPGRVKGTASLLCNRMLNVSSTVTVLPCDGNFYNDGA